jgi:hypothetical protein
VRIEEMMGLVLVKAEDVGGRERGEGQGQGKERRRLRDGRLEVCMGRAKADGEITGLRHAIEGRARHLGRPRRGGMMMVKRTRAPMLLLLSFRDSFRCFITQKGKGHES